MKIPHFEMPGLANGSNFSNEKLMDIKKHFKDEIIIEPQYHMQAIPGSTNKCLARESVIEKLETAIEHLPDGVTIKIYDAWRPLSVQTELFKKYYNKLKNEKKDLSEEKLIELTKMYVSYPSTDITAPPVHTTGGAIDLTLFDKTINAELNMGTKFDSFSEKTVTDYYEITGSDEVRVNRRLLYATMINAGFTNLPSEWWHYDYGTAFWSYYTGKSVLYSGIFTI